MKWALHWSAEVKKFSIMESKVQNRIRLPGGFLGHDDQACGWAFLISILTKPFCSHIMQLYQMQLQKEEYNDF